MANSVVDSKSAKSLSINRFDSLDSPPIRVAVLSKATASKLGAVTGLPARTAAAIARVKPKRFADLSLVPGMRQETLEKVRRLTLDKGDTRLAILDVAPANKRIMSYRAFALDVSFAATDLERPVLVCVNVRWAGKPFVVEKRISPAEAARGRTRVRFGKAHSLPPGAAAFLVSLFRTIGSTASNGWRRSSSRPATAPSSPRSR